MSHDKEKEDNEELEVERIVEFPDGTVKNVAELTKEERDMLDYYINAASSRAIGFEVLRPIEEEEHGKKNN